MRLTGVIPYLEVFDMETSLQFYRDILGFEVASESEGGGWCRLQAGAVSIMLNTAYDTGERPDVPDASRVRAHRDVALYFESDPDIVYALLDSHNWPVSKPRAMRYGVMQVDVQDPDGYGLAFTRPL
jgi:catechol 2,3-dioxygenase-like lactoylglutathione lyase family enzyme